MIGDAYATRLPGRTWAQVRYSDVILHANEGQICHAARATDRLAPATRLQPQRLANRERKEIEGLPLDLADGDPDLEAVCNDEGQPDNDDCEGEDLT